MSNSKPFLTIDSASGIHIEITNKEGKGPKEMWTLTKKLIDKYFETEISQEAKP